jgi:hypothetical protein
MQSLRTAQRRYVPSRSHGRAKRTIAHNFVFGGGGENWSCLGQNPEKRPCSLTQLILQFFRLELRLHVGYSRGLYSYRIRCRLSSVNFVIKLHTRAWGATTYAVNKIASVLEKLLIV